MPAFSLQRNLPVCLLLLFVLSGCSGENKTDSGKETGPAESETSSHNDDLVNSSYSMLQPDRFGITSNPHTVVGMLNQWLKQETTVGGKQLATPPAAELLLDEDMAEKVAFEKFNDRDTRYIRTSFLFRDINAVLLADTPSDLDRSTLLFEHVITTIQKEDAHQDGIALTPFTVYMLGQGTAEDQAWMYVEHLRQLKLDTIVLEFPAATETDPEKSKAKTNAPWLVGVLLEDGIHLFDFRSGLVVSNETTSESVTPDQPATLTAFLKDEKLQERFLGGKLTDQQKEQIQIKIVGNSSIWASRMQLYQDAMIGDQTVVLYQLLKGGKESPGVMERVAKAAGDLAKKTETGIWSYPEDQLREFENRNEAEARVLDNQWEVFRVPFEKVSLDPKRKTLSFGRPTNELRMGRNLQLLGKFGDSISRYLRVRLDSTFPEGFYVDDKVKQLHTEGFENAFFWQGQVKFQQGEYDAALNSLSDYLRKNPKGARWRKLAYELLALSYAHVGEYEQAIDTLKEAGADINPLRVEVLTKRWQSRIQGQPEKS